jgi:hypothetical protein
MPARISAKPKPSAVSMSGLLVCGNEGGIDATGLLFLGEGMWLADGRGVGVADGLTTTCEGRGDGEP